MIFIIVNIICNKSNNFIYSQNYCSEFFYLFSNIITTLDIKMNIVDKILQNRSNC